MINQIKIGIRKPPIPNWTKESKKRMVENIRKTRLKTIPIGSRRRHNSGETIYWVIKVSDRGKWKYEHRVIMEKIIGRPIKKEEIVHHINHNSLDNRPENLELTNQSSHMTYHGKLRPNNPNFHGPLKNGKWSIKFDKCIKCFKTDSKHSHIGICNRCYQKILRSTFVQ